jgi:hypothetical protein
LRPISRSVKNQTRNLLAAVFTPVSWLAYSLTLKMEVTSLQKFVELQRPTWHCSSEHKTVLNSAVRTSKLTYLSFLIFICSFPFYFFFVSRLYFSFSISLSSYICLSRLRCSFNLPPLSSPTALSSCTEQSEVFKSVIRCSLPVHRKQFPLLSSLISRITVSKTRLYALSGVEG